MTLTEFLLARIAEDEAQAKRSVAQNATNPNLRIPASWIEGVATRVLAECEAKRMIVSPHKSGGGEYGKGYADAVVDTLCCLASVYADHPDYREEWRP